MHRSSSRPSSTRRRGRFRRQATKSISPSASMHTGSRSHRTAPPWPRFAGARTSPRRPSPSPVAVRVDLARPLPGARQVRRAQRNRAAHPSSRPRQLLSDQRGERQQLRLRGAVVDRRRVTTRGGCVPCRGSKRPRVCDRRRAGLHLGVRAWPHHLQPPGLQPGHAAVRDLVHHGHERGEDRRLGGLLVPDGVDGRRRGQPVHRGRRGGTVRQGGVQVLQPLPNGDYLGAFVGHPEIEQDWVLGILGDDHFLLGYADLRELGGEDDNGRRRSSSRSRPRTTTSKSTRTARRSPRTSER